MIQLIRKLRHLKYPQINFLLQLHQTVLDSELTGGIYFSYPKERTDEVATDTLTYHRHEIERIVSYAFQLASKRK
ncbi:isocitrate/isopropylmalate family dehydrogenase, partial [Bacillus sp. B-TM1]